MSPHFEHIVAFWFNRHRHSVRTGDLLGALVSQRCFENYRWRDPLGKMLIITK